MKIARFSHQDAIRFGIVDDTELVVLVGDPLFAGYETTGDRVPLADATLLAPVIPRSKVVGIERSAAGGVGVFLKPNTAVIGGEDVVVRPRQAQVTDYAPGLAVVIGRIAKNVAAESVADHVLGYTVAADITARDLFAIDGSPDRAKGFDTFCPLGPVIDTEIAADASLTVSHNGQIVREASLTDIVDAVPAAVAFASSVFTLLPGDVVLLPVAGAPVVFAARDTFETEVSGIGVLRTAARDA